MDIYDRLNKVIEHENVSVSSFAKKINIGDQTIRNIVVNRRNEPGLKVLNAIVQSFDWLNADWLIAGRGDMIKTQECPISADIDTVSFIREQSKQIADLNTRIIELTEEKTRYKILYEESKKDAHSDASANANAECVIVNVPPTGTTNR